MNEFKDYQPRTYLLNDKKGDFLADSYNILKRWKNYFSQLALPEAFPLRLELLSQS
jgi:hypothetical protein